MVGLARASADFFQSPDQVQPRFPSRRFRSFLGLLPGSIAGAGSPYQPEPGLFRSSCLTRFSPGCTFPPPCSGNELERSINFLAQIPADASVTATTYLVPHVSGRRAVLRMPMNPVS